MSVLIRGMEMPKSCWECEVGSASQLDNNTCPFYAMEGQEQENYQNKIAEGCPISYVPPHGRLIDVDALPTSRVEWEDIVNAPTIIEAEEWLKQEAAE